MLVTDEALVKEVEEAFTAMDGEDGERMKTEVERVRGKIDNVGRSWKALRAVAEL